MVVRIAEEGVTNGGEAERVNFDTEGGHILLLELAGQVTLHEGGLPVVPNELVIVLGAVEAVEDYCHTSTVARR